MRRPVAVSLVLACFIGFAGRAYGQGISGTDHDFRSKSWNTTGQICIVCHATHNNAVTVANAPLWNHQLTAAAFTVYASPTLNAGPLGQPVGISKLCLSCHDGTVALENFGGTTNGTNFISGSKNLGTNLANDHPISYNYTTALATADGGLWDPATKLSGIAGSTGTIQTDMLFANSLECASCHDVHNKYGISKLLRKSNSASGLCLTCHNK